MVRVPVIKETVRAVPWILDRKTRARPGRSRVKPCSQERILKRILGFLFFFLNTLFQCHVHILVENLDKEWKSLLH